MDFTYEVIRLWRQSVKRFLTGGLGTLPLAPLCQLPAGMSVKKGLASVIQQVVERLEREAPPEDRARLLSATYVLTGLRVSSDVADRLFQGVGAMKESSTYQAIIKEGEVRALQKTLLRLGRDRLGRPTEAVQAEIAALTDVERLERMTSRLLVVSSWQELVKTE